MTRPRRAPTGQPVGVDHHAAKLDEDTVRALRMWVHERGLCIKCALIVVGGGVAYGTAFDAVTFVTWKHVR